MTRSSTKGRQSDCDGDYDTDKTVDDDELEKVKSVSPRGGAGAVGAPPRGPPPTNTVLGKRKRKSADMSENNPTRKRGKRKAGKR